MTTITVKQAQADLAALIDNLVPGEELIITRDDHPIAKLQSYSHSKPQPQFGNCKGKLIILEEDDEHLKDFAEYMP